MMLSNVMDQTNKVCIKATKGCMHHAKCITCKCNWHLQLNGATQILDIEILIN